MYIKKYPTLTDAYQSLNLGLAGSDIHSTIHGCHCVPEPLYLEVDKATWDIPLDRLCYSDRKFDQLEREYFSLERFNQFLERVQKLSWRECTIFQFKRKPPRCGVERENCLQYIHYCKAEDLYMVHWRTTELGMRWGADLAWMATLLPGVHMVLEIPHSYQHLHCWPGVTETLGIEPKLEDNIYGRIYRKTREMYYPPNLDQSMLAGWGPINMIQKRVIEYRRAK